MHKRLHSITAAAAFAVGTLTAASLAAHAETFEDAAINARRVQEPMRLIWPYADACKLKSDVARRACEGIRAVRQAALTGKTFVTTTTGGVDIGNFDKGAVAVTAKGCIQCTPAKVEGDSWFVVSSGTAGGDADGMVGPALAATTQKVADETEAKRWAGEEGRRLSSEVVYTLTGDKVAGKGGAQALVAKIVAYRVIDRCTGDVLLSTPESAAAAAPSTSGECSGTTQAPDKGGKQPEPDDGTPVELSRWDIQRTMNALKAQVTACHKKYQIPGNAQAQVEIATDGSVKSVSLKGDFQGTPTGTCLIKVVQAAKFPAFKKGPMKVDYPFILR